MGKLNQVRDGRQSHAYLVSFADTPVTTGTLLKGRYYAVDAIASTGSGFADGVEVGDIIYTSDQSIKLGTGDKATLCELDFLGFVNNKSLSQSKSVQEITCDKDASANYVSSGIVEGSGSISGYNIMLDDAHASVNRLKASFNKVSIYDGKETKVNKQTNSKFVILINYDAKDVEVGEHMDIMVVPCYLTSNEQNAEYNSGGTLNIGFQVADSDEYGHKKGEIQTIYAAPETASTGA